MQAHTRAHVALLYTHTEVTHTEVTHTVSHASWCACVQVVQGELRRVPGCLSRAHSSQLWSVLYLPQASRGGVWGVLTAALVTLLHRPPQASKGRGGDVGWL